LVTLQVFHFQSFKRLFAGFEAHSGKKLSSFQPCAAQSVFPFPEVPELILLKKNHLGLE
jgi:hypothetical protein